MSDAATLAVTVGEVPVVPVSMATAAPSVPVCVPEVMNPDVVEKFTVTPLTNVPAELRTVATITAVGGRPESTIVAVRAIEAGVVVDDEALVEEMGLSVHPAFRMHKSSRSRRARNRGSIGYLTKGAALVDPKKGDRPDGLRVTPPNCH